MTRTADPKFLVAEVTLNWPNTHGDLISERFAEAIAVNDRRGYDLVSHSYGKVAVADPDTMKACICETIVGVFRRRTEEP